MSIDTDELPRLSQYLQHLRRQRSLTIRDMAALCDMPRSTLYQIVARGVIPKHETLARIASGLSIDVSELYRIAYADAPPTRDDLGRLTIMWGYLGPRQREQVLGLAASYMRSECLVKLGLADPPTSDDT